MRLCRGGRDDPLVTPAFSSHGRALAAGSSRLIRLGNVLTGQEFLTLNGHADYINARAFSPEGRTLASSSHDDAVNHWRSEWKRTQRWLIAC
jgi:WD40 repeat protein